jgi:hypothetical protein
MSNDYEAQLQTPEVTPEVKFLTSFDARPFNFGRHGQNFWASGVNDARTPSNGSTASKTGNYLWFMLFLVS